MTIIVLFAAFIGVIMLTVFGAIKSSDAYKTALARAKADQRVIDAIGTPIKEAWYVLGKTEVSGGSGTSELTIPISGPKGKATIYANSEKFAGDWKFSRMVVKIESTSQTIDLTNGKMEESDQPQNQAGEQPDESDNE
ncbi:MAG TPA: cytochrome c oxidase assembly factor Coa1 family protein [Chthoniobacterales bacterium]|nr:cytochrome c oxidase assembly factor Coa1 family protein [Chthoniobacterales bacterium]